MMPTLDQSTTHRPALLVAVVLALVALLCLSGCGRSEHEARAAADIWHAAEAIRRGADPARPITAIQAAAEAIVQSAGYRLDPEGADLVLPRLRQEAAQ